MMKSVSSCNKSLWVMLSGSTLLKSKDFIGNTLQDNEDRLVNGISFFKKRSPRDEKTEKEELKNLGPNIPAEFIIKLSMTLDVDLIQSFDQFTAFLTYEYQGSSSSISGCFTCEKNIQSLISDLMDFYFQQRLFALLSLKEVISHYANPELRHPYRQIFSDFIANINKDDPHRLINSLMSQYRVLVTETDTASFGFMKESMQQKRFAALAKEKFELLQLMILYMDTVTPTVGQIKQYMNILNDCLIENRLLNKATSIEGVNQSIPFLQNVLLVQMLQLDPLFKILYENSEETHYLLQDIETLKLVDSYVRDMYSSVAPNSLVFLSWMVVRAFEIEGLKSGESEQIISQFLSIVTQSNIMDYIVQFFASNLFIECLQDTRVGSILRRIVATPFNCAFTLFKVTPFCEGSETVLFSLMCHLLSEDSVSSIVMTPGTGFLKAFLQSIDIFRQDPSWTLKLLASMAKSCAIPEIIHLISNFKYMTQILPVTSDLIALSNEGTQQATPSYVSVKDHAFKCGLQTVVVAKGSVGRVVSYHKVNDSSVSNVTIRWDNLSFCLWSVLRAIYQSKIDLINSSRIRLPQDEDSLDILCLINNLCEEVINATGKNKIPYEIKLLMDDAINMFSITTRLRSVPRRFVSSVLNMLSALVQQNSGTGRDVWKVCENNVLFPYLVGPAKDVPSLMAGNDVHSSIIGQTIVSQECTSGSYILCSSFLKFMSKVVPAVPMDKNLMASVVYIFNEIFPVYRIWRMDIKEHEAIGFSCYSIAQFLISSQATSPVEKQLVSYIRTVLLTGSAGENLLETITRGKEVVSKVITCNGTSSSFTHREIIATRLSLSILNQLLRFKESDAKRGVPTAVENALFNIDNPVRSYNSNVNMLLLLCHYVFQPHDFRLAVLGGQILKRLAKSFPMSIHACLGTNSQAVKEHFLFRLESLTEDIRVKVAILDFLSVCVEHQPGMIELFVNHGSLKSDVEAAPPLLSLVLNNLRDRIDGQTNCPPELHAASMKLISAFWVNSNLLTVNELKKNYDLWKLICFPIFSDREEDFTIDNELFAHVLKIVAREIFFGDRLKKELDQSLQTIVYKGLENRLEATSLHIKTMCTSTPVEVANDSRFHLLTAWKGILVSFSKFDKIKVSDDLKIKLYLDFLFCFQKQLELKADDLVLDRFADTLMITFPALSTNLMTTSFDEWFKISSHILQTVWRHREEMEVNLLCCLLSLYSQYTISFGKMKLNKDQTFLLTNWIFNASEILFSSFTILNKYVADHKTLFYHRLTTSSITFLNSLIIATADHTENWISVIRPYSVIEYMSQIMTELLQQQFEPELTSSMITLLISFASIPETASIILMSTPENLSWVGVAFKSDIEPRDERSIQSWRKVYLLTLKFLKSLVMSSGPECLPNVLTIVTNNIDRLIECMVSFRMGPKGENMQETLELLTLIRLLIPYKTFWHKNFTLSFDILMHQVSCTSFTVAGFQLRPNLFEYAITHPTSLQACIMNESILAKMTSTGIKRSPSLGKTPVKKVTFGDKVKEGESSAQKGSSSNPDKRSNEDLDRMLDRILHESTSILFMAAPSLGDIRNCDPDSWFVLHLANQFSTPSIDHNQNASFGSVLYTLRCCVRAINQNKSLQEASGSHQGCLPNKDPYSSTQHKQGTMERALSLLVTQAMIAQGSVHLKPEEKQKMLGELKSELNSILPPLTRSRRSIGSSGRKSPSSQTFQEYPVVKFLIEDVVAKM